MANASGTDLAKLEYEFATNPNSEAFIPLAEAYLGMGRYVEAMVVCKKGIKAHPELPTGRLIMARIYTDQAKHQKAIEELKNLLKIGSSNADALTLLGQIHLKLNREEEGVTYLKNALDVDTTHQKARESLLKIGIDYVPTGKPFAQGAKDISGFQATPSQPVEPQASSSEMPTEKALPAVAQAVTVPEGLPDRRPLRSAPEAATLLTEKKQATLPLQDQERTTLARPATRSAATQKRIIDRYGQMESLAPPSKAKSFKFTIFLGGGLVLGLIGFLIYQWQLGLREDKIDEHRTEARKEFRRDTYLGYLIALKEYRNLLDVDNNDIEALSRAAFSTAVLVGEFGADRTVLAQGQKYLQAALQMGESQGMLTTAQAMMILHADANLPEAERLLRDDIKNNPDSPLLNSALGRVLLHKGDLVEAKKYLQVAAKNELRAQISAGLFAMQRSMYSEAVRAFRAASELERSNTLAMLYQTLTYLIWGNQPGLTGAAQKSYAQYLEEVERLKNRLVSLEEKYKIDPAEAKKPGAPQDPPIYPVSKREEVLAELIESILRLRDSGSQGFSTGLAKLKELTKREANDEWVQFAVAREFRAWGKNKLAKETIDRAVRLKRSRTDFILEQAALLIEKREFDEARNLALKMHEADPESGLSLIRVGDAYLGENKFEDAERYYQKSKDFGDVGALANFKMGQLYLAKPSPDENRAQAQLEQAIEGLGNIDRRLAANAAFTLARIYANKSQENKKYNERFFKMITQAKEFDASFAPPYCLLGINLPLETKEGREEAKENCQKCVQLDQAGTSSRACRDVLSKLK